MKKKEILKLAKRDFEKAWVETGLNLKRPHHDDEYPRLHLKTGQTHPLNDTIAKLRQAYLLLSFLRPSTHYSLKMIIFTVSSDQKPLPS